ncbi:DUF445 family protein [Corynebacterium hindlerae]|uniref:DUF445 family protein n=1 Tax=Corynebacterium hindlerae TaxID=699041 RepID=A0A7G5FIN2_9CORY|nr:DUF445 family protein [Corynebacterium hindlerae]QMV86473.1 DUF445 family protein [Corynebacterium hindlerae]
MPTPADEAERRVALKRHKFLATALLGVAAVIFLSCRYAEARLGITGAWIGYVRAAAEAGMVGGLADWFAVTALFKHPMGLKIPHTAIVKRKKDQVGVAMSDFISSNFLNAELITEKVREFGIPEKLASWLVDPANADKVSAEAGRLTVNVVRAMDPADAEQLIKTVLVDKAAEPRWGPPLGKLLEQLIEDGKTEPLVEETVRWVHRKVTDNQAFIVEMVDERLPRWAPRFVHDLVGDKVYREAVEWTSAVAHNPDHEARQALRDFIDRLAHDLQHDEVMIARVEDWKHDVMGSRPVLNAPQQLWAATSRGIIAAASDPESPLRTKIAESAVVWGNNLRDDSDLRQSLDRRITGATRFLADNYAPAVAEIISETVARWDAEEAADKIELMVGKDLQYIRLNGTIVGALAGLAIYAVSQLLFGSSLLG